MAKQFDKFEKENTITEQMLDELAQLSSGSDDVFRSPSSSSLGSSPSEIASPVDIESPSEIASPVDIESPSEIASPVDIESPSEIASPVDIKSPSEIASPVDIESPSEIASPSESTSSEEVSRFRYSPHIVHKLTVANLKRHQEEMPQHSAQLKCAKYSPDGPPPPIEYDPTQTSQEEDSFRQQDESELAETEGHTDTEGGWLADDEQDEPGLASIWFADNEQDEPSLAPIMPIDHNNNEVNLPLINDEDSPRQLTILENATLHNMAQRDQNAPFRPSPADATLPRLYYHKQYEDINGYTKLDYQCSLSLMQAAPYQDIFHNAEEPSAAVKRFIPTLTLVVQRQSQLYPAKRLAKMATGIVRWQQAAITFTESQLITDNEAPLVEPANQITGVTVTYLDGHSIFLDVHAMNLERGGGEMLPYLLYLLEDTNEIRYFKSQIEFKSKIELLLGQELAADHVIMARLSPILHPKEPQGINGYHTELIQAIYDASHYKLDFSKLNTTLNRKMYQWFENPQAISSQITYSSCIAMIDNFLIRSAGERLYLIQNGF